MVYVIYPRCNGAEPSNPKVCVACTSAFHQAWLFTLAQYIPLGATFEVLAPWITVAQNVLVMPYNLHFSRPVVGRRQTTVVQITYTMDGCFQTITIRQSKPVLIKQLAPRTIDSWLCGYQLLANMVYLLLVNRVLLRGIAGVWD